MTKKTCPLGEDCDLTIAWMKGAEDARDKAKARIAALEDRLAKAFVIMEREIKRVQQLRQDFQANSKKPLRVSLFDVQCEYEDILAEMKGDKT